MQKVCFNLRAVKTLSPHLVRHQGPFSVDGISPNDYLGVATKLLRNAHFRHGFYPPEKRIPSMSLPPRWTTSLGVGVILAGCLFSWHSCGQRSPEPLFEQLRSMDPDERLKAANALLRYGDEVVSRLMEEYDSKLIRVRFETVKLFGRIKDDRALPVLHRALSDKSSNVAQAAAWSLGELRAAESLDPLLDYTQDSSKGMRSQVLRALGTCHDYDENPALSDSARNQITLALQDPVGAIRIAALLGIHEFGYRGAIDETIRMSRDPSPEVRHVAVQALGHIAAGSAPGAEEVSPRIRSSIVEALIVALDEADYQSIRTKAVRALEDIGDPRVIQHLERLRDAGTEDDRREAGGAIERLRP